MRMECIALIDVRCWHDGKGKNAALGSRRNGGAILGNEISKNIYTGQLLLRRIYPPDSLVILRRLSRIHSPNLMAIYDAEIIGNVCVALCEFISGITLEESVRQRGLYNEYAAAKIAAAICAGLSALHSAGIIHRDINPSNVMLDQSGCVKIIDYDIARIANPEKTPTALRWIR